MTRFFICINRLDILHYQLNLYLCRLIRCHGKEKAGHSDCDQEQEGGIFVLSAHFLHGGYCAHRHGDQIRARGKNPAQGFLCVDPAWRGMDQRHAYQSL